MSAAPKRVGLVVGREWSFPPAFLEEVNKRDAGVVAEFATFGGEHMDAPRRYDVLVDRISHEVPFYRTVLKKAVVDGVTVINNPFMWSADDKFLGASLITKLGVASPKTVVLPNKEYVPGIVPNESLRNLQYPLDWDGIIAHVGMPSCAASAWARRRSSRSSTTPRRASTTSSTTTSAPRSAAAWSRTRAPSCAPSATT
ncbi:MAG: hypothetical protein MUF40_08030 [Gemmatimonadaceae bacterium]|nr:hypothetical protein [Gemmatimonadaceae bacterium]